MIATGTLHIFSLMQEENEIYVLFLFTKTNKHYNIPMQFLKIALKK